MDRFDEMRGKIGGGGGGAVIIPPEAGNLTGIVVTKTPNKVAYNIGDTIDLTGVEVTAVFDNDVRAVVTGACEFAVNTPLTVYDTTVTVSYEGFTTTFSISVYGKTYQIPNGTKYLFHFEGNLINEISGTADATSSNFSYKGGKFSNGVSASRMSVSSSTMPTIKQLTSGDANATIEFWVYFPSSPSDGEFAYTGYGNDHECIQYLSISKAIRVQGFRIPNGSTSISELKYSLSSDFMGKWHHFAIVYNTGTKTLFIDGKNVLSGACDVLLYNSFEARVGKNSSWIFDEWLISTEALYTDDFEVPTNVYGGKRILESLTVETQPTKTDYRVGETFSLSGAVIKATYSDATQVDVTSECVVVSDTNITSTTKFMQIAYTFEGITKTVFVNIGVITD